MNNFDLTKYKFFKELTKFDFVERIILFGSRARRDNLERSDIDIAIVCPEATDKEWLSLLDCIENADTLLKIDCVRFDTLVDNTDLKNNIKSEGLEVYVKTNS